MAGGGVCVSHNKGARKNNTHLIQYNAKGGKHETCSSRMIDGLWTEGTLTEIVINVAQAAFSVVQMTAPVVLGDKKSNCLACPVNQLAATHDY